MPPRKLSAEDKLAIVDLYREPGQTTGTVAEQYEVSVSTISRLLKSELAAAEYDALVKQKRAGAKDAKKGEEKSSGSVRSRRTIKKSATVKKSSSTVKKKTSTVKRKKAQPPVEVESPVEDELPLEPETQEPEIQEPEIQDPVVQDPVVQEVEHEEPVKLEVQGELEETTEAAPEPTKPAAPVRRRRRRSRGAKDDESTVQLELTAAEEPAPEPVVLEDAEDKELGAEADIAATEEPLPEVGVAEDEDALADTDLAAVEDDDFSDDFEEELEDDGLDEEEDDEALTLHPQSVGDDQLEILPISEADLERMLYLVIDRTADLITCPMQEFRDLGQVPSEEEALATLPIFDNHRIARRFSKRNQRVIKVPDGRLLAKTAPWLEAKGITRCLLDGQVYSLETSS